MNFKIFRHYDIRGTFKVDFFENDIVTITNGILNYFEKKPLPQKIITLGHDARLSSPIIHKIFLEISRQRGFDIVDFGLCSTPIISSAYLFDNKLIARVMITASHNPWQDNGFKIFYKEKNVFSKEIQAIKKNVEETLAQDNLFETNQTRLGNILPSKKNLKMYLNFLKKKFTFIFKIKTQISLAFDCMHGTAGIILEQLFTKDIKKVFLFRTEPFLKKKINLHSSEENIPHSPDPTNLKNLTKTLSWLTENNLPFCFVFDGDTDRVSVLLSCGKLLLGEEILAFFVQNIGFKKNSNVVVDISCSSLINQVAKKENLNVYFSPVGIANIKRKMKACSAVLGGENSCHFIFGNQNFLCDDGIFNSLIFFKKIIKKNIKLTTWVKKLPKTFTSFPEKIFLKTTQSINVIFSKIKNHFKKNKKLVNLIKIDGAKFFFEKNSSILIRKSNTEDCLSLRFEANNKTRLKIIRHKFFHFLSKNLQKEFSIK